MKKQKRWMDWKRWGAVIGCMLLTMGLFGCGEEKETPTPGYTADRVQFSYVATPLNVPSIVEKEKNLLAAAYEPFGVQAVGIPFAAGAEQIAALASGDVQILPAVGGTSALLAAANGADLKILGIYSRSPKTFALYSNDETITTPEALRGKTVAGTKGSNLHELLAAYLAAAGMTVEDVNFVSMNMPNALAALENGSVDAALVAGSAAYACEKKGKHRVTDGEGLISGAIVTATTQKFYEENPELIAIFRQTQAEILAYIQAHPEEAVQMAAEELDIPEAAVREMLPLYDFSMEMQPEDVASLQSTVQFLYDAHMMEKEIQVEDFLLPDK